ncbi:hypothetical protein JOM56_004344 [Amanita muscaria]
MRVLLMILRAGAVVIKWLASEQVNGKTTRMVGGKSSLQSIVQMIKTTIVASPALRSVLTSLRGNGLQSEERDCEENFHCSFADEFGTLKYATFYRPKAIGVGIRIVNTEDSHWFH